MINFLVCVLVLQVRSDVEYPQITLSAAEDPYLSDEDYGMQRDSVLEVGQVGHHYNLKTS